MRVSSHPSCFIVIIYTVSTLACLERKSSKFIIFIFKFSEETIFDVVGCLEYDPSSPAPKRHRQYLKQLAR